MLPTEHRIFPRTQSNLTGGERPASQPALSRRELIRLGVAGMAVGLTRGVAGISLLGATKAMMSHSTRFEVVAEGFVTRRDPKSPAPVAVGSRCVLIREGELVCTYMVLSKLGINDAVPTISRSRDSGKTWQEQGPIWPQGRGKQSSSCSVSRSPAGELFLYGTSTPIDQPGESDWSAATQGLKPNQLVWAKSTDSGRTWTEPVPIPMPIPGAAEAPGALCITRRGRWLAPYSPYNTFDPKLIVDRNQVVVLRSDDQGKNWRHGSLLRFEDVNSCGAEAWVIELADGRLLGTGWHVNLKDGGPDYPNAYALSRDGGETWTPTRSTGILGQSTALAPLPDGRALFIYNQRKHGEVGVWLAVVKPTESDFGIETNRIVWRAEKIAQRGTSGDFSQWEDFAFGEPSVTVLPDRSLFVTLWCVQPSGQGIRYVKLKMVD